MFESNPMLVVVSDLHFGGGDTYNTEFIWFLQEIRKQLDSSSTFRENFRAIIIMGDMFDLIMNTHENIIKDFTQIYDLIQELRNKYHIQIIETLGNHEISVTGNYEKDFTFRKLDFIKEFNDQIQNHFYKWDFINKDFFCQYIMLEVDPKSEEWVLNCYDSKYQMQLESPNNSTPMKLGKAKKAHKILKADKPFKCLMCHGYQFYKVETQLFGTVAWNPLLKASQSFKESANAFYNESGIRETLLTGMEVTKDSIDQAWKKWKANNPQPKWDLKKKLKTELLRKEIEQMLKSQNNIFKMTNDEEKVVERLQEEYYKGVTHVLFGHTHKKMDSVQDGIVLMNDGAWQHVYPSYITISREGQIELVDLETMPIDALKNQ